MFPSRVLASAFNSLQTLNVCGDSSAGLTATGTNLATALPIVSVYTQFTTVAGSTGAALPTTEIGELLIVANDGANSLTIYPQTGSTIEGASSYSLAAGKRVIIYAITLTKWLAILGA